MKKLVLLSALFAALCVPALAGNQGGNNQGGNNQGGNSQGGGHHGVPVPMAGAGLPIIAAGYGVYWLMRRRKPK